MTDTADSVLTPEIKATIESHLVSTDPGDVVRALEVAIFQQKWNGSSDDSPVVKMVKKDKTLTLIREVEDGIEDGSIVPKATKAATITGSTAHEDEEETFGVVVDEDMLAAYDKRPKPPKQGSDDKGYDADSESDLSKF